MDGSPSFVCHYPPTKGIECTALDKCPIFTYSNLEILKDRSKCHEDDY
jgi:hypothetical protein